VPGGYFYICSWAKYDWLTDIASRIWQVFMPLEGRVSRGRWRCGWFSVVSDSRWGGWGFETVSKGCWRSGRFRVFWFVKPGCSDADVAIFV